MKKLTKYDRVAGYLERIYRAANEDLFGGKLEMPCITIQSTPRAYGHMSTAKIWQNGDEWRRELNIGAGTISRPIEDVVATLIHEMVHIANEQDGIKDTSNNGVYHNRKFKDRAEATGMLTIEKVQTYGWTKTEPTEALLNWCILNGLEDIQIGRVELNGLCSGGKGKDGGSANGDATEKPKKTSSTRKYICPKCGQSVRATKAVNIKCGDCDLTMIPQI